MTDRPLITAIGCSGEVSLVFLKDLLAQGYRVRVLSRHPERLNGVLPGADLIQGSMLAPADVARATEGADAALLVTPIGSRNSNQIEIDGAGSVIEAARSMGLRHLIYISNIGIDEPTGAPLLDSKRKIETMLADSGVPYTAIRCGSYMEDVIDKRMDACERGLWVFPVKRSLPFHFTSMRDVPRMIGALVERGPLNGPIDLITERTYTPAETARMLGDACGKKVIASGRFPIFYLLWLLWPVLYLLGHRLATIFPLIRHFNKAGYTAAPGGRRLEGFRVTTLEEHIGGAFRHS